MANLTQKDRAAIRELTKRFPQRVTVHVARAKEGGFVAEVEEFPGCITQAETFAELIEMVNDAIATILEVPRKYLPYVPAYMPPISLAKKLNVWPDGEAKRENTIQLTRV